LLQRFLSCREANLKLTSIVVDHSEAESSNVSDLQSRKDIGRDSDRQDAKPEYRYAGFSGQ